jgi:Zn-dependent protease with chaperone function
VALLLLGVLLAEPISRWLAAARWPASDPTGALLLWQAVGLAVAHTLAARRRHRDLLDLLSTPWPAMAGARVLDHPLPVAYCLPGLRSRLVLSEGMLTILSPTELAAVLAHERTHVRERHDLVVLPFVAWGATAPWVSGMALAQAAVAALIEMRADDVAMASAGITALAGALRQVGVPTPAGGDRTLGSFSAAVVDRLHRLDHYPRTASWYQRAAPRLTALALVAVPTAVLLR